MVAKEVLQRKLQKLQKKSLRQQVKETSWFIITKQLTTCLFLKAYRK